MENNTYESIQEWNKLLKQGIITENEFQVKKAELLNNKGGQTFKSQLEKGKSVEDIDAKIYKTQYYSLNNEIDKEIVNTIENLGWLAQYVKYKGTEIKVKKKGDVISCKLSSPFTYDLRVWALGVIAMLLLSFIFQKLLTFFIIFGGLIGWYLVPYIGDYFYAKKFPGVIEEFESKYIKNLK